jgi:hypothetical protein
MKFWAHLLMASFFLLIPFANSAQAMPDAMPLLLAAPWNGSYVCNQGLTRLQLSLRPLAGGITNKVEADFVFSAAPDNPRVATGSFHLKGTLDSATGTLVLKQDRWIEQPDDPSYRMVDLEGKIVVGDGQAMIRGRVTTYGCEDFAVWQFFHSADSAGR